MGVLETCGGVTGGRKRGGLGRIKWTHVKRGEGGLRVLEVKVNSGLGRKTWTTWRSSIAAILQ